MLLVLDIAFEIIEAAFLAPGISPAHVREKLLVPQ